MIGLYRAVSRLAAPALRLMLARRRARGKELPDRLPERFGIDRTPRPPGKLLWVHAASLGETVAMLPVLAGLPPTITVLITTGTVTSARLLEARMADLPGTALHRFVPLDVPAWVARFLDHWRPDAAAFVESEIWPNLLLACQARAIPLALINARLSPRSARRWSFAPATARRLFAGFALIIARAPDDAARLAALGAPAPLMIGNLKYAAPPLPYAEPELSRLTTLLAGRPAWLAASTHPGEDTLLLEAHRRLAATFPALLTIIVPRHPERGVAMAALMNAPRRSLGQDPPPGPGIWLADTMGELGLFYRLAPIVFVGKSLGAAGGQNPLEPARLGAAVCIGPEIANFADIVPPLIAAGALRQVPDLPGLVAFITDMLTHPTQRDAMGTAGQAAASSLADLPQRVADTLTSMLVP